MELKGKLSKPEKQAIPDREALKKALKVRSNLCAGADCSEGIDYWRKEYNYWKNLAQSMGCV